MNYELVIGLEIHVKLNSENKLFCGCKNIQDFDNLRPNTHICPVCTGQPGALPVLQQGALDKALKLGKALGCTINERSQFDRKSYFYPDLPMGYQITQNYRPTCIDGNVTYYMNHFQSTKTVHIKQAHMETDTGKTIHIGGMGLLDFNRAGTPLVEIVTQPDFRSDEEVTEFLKELQRIARYNNVGDCDLEKGQMRCDVNISIRPEGTEAFGTRVELKNINSFGAIKRAIFHEFERQKTLITGGQTIDQETRGRDDQAGNSYGMRSKVDAIDYRYVPEPDLPTLITDQAKFSQIETLSPFEKVTRYLQTYQFNKEFIYGLINDTALNEYFESCVSQLPEPKLIAKWLVGPIAGWMTEHQKTIKELLFSRETFIDFCNHIATGKLNDNQAKIIIQDLLTTGKNLTTLIQEKGFTPSDINELKPTIIQTLEQHPTIVAEYKAGKTQVLGFLMGQVMKSTGGKANPKELTPVLQELLSS